MRTLTTLAAFLVLLQGCQSDPSREAAVPSVQPAEPLVDLDDTTSPTAQHWLRDRLSVIDDPLPTGEELEETLADAQGSLLELADGPPSPVTYNALLLLGRFETSTARLGAIAADEERSPMVRGSAVAGLGSQPVEARLQVADLLFELTRHPNVSLAANAVSACEGLPDAPSLYDALAADDSVHPTVRRHAERKARPSR